MNKDSNAPPPGFVPPPPYNPGPGPQMPMAPPNVILVQQTFGSESQRMTCPQCGSNISTRIDTGPNTKTHLFALLLCLMGCWPCAPCPYCIDSCLSKKHYCPSCQAFLGQSDN